MTLPRGPLPPVPSEPGRFDEVRGHARRRRTRRTTGFGAVGAAALALVVLTLVPNGSALEADDSLVASPGPTSTTSASATPTVGPMPSATAAPTGSASPAPTVTGAPVEGTPARPTDAQVVAVTPGCEGRRCVVVSRAEVPTGTVAAVTVERGVVPAQVRYVLVRDGDLVSALPRSADEWAAEYLGEDSVRVDPDAPRNVLVLVNGGATAWWVHAFRPTATSLGLLSGPLEDPSFYGDGRTQLLAGGGFDVGAHRKLEQSEEVRVVRHAWDGRAYVRTRCEHQPGGDGKDEYPC